MIQGQLLFPGIQRAMAWSFTFSGHGISPSVAQITLVPQYDQIASFGTMTLTDGNDSIDFFDCCVDSATIVRNNQGLLVYLHIFDRRWRWKFGEIWGAYNRRNEDGTVAKGSQKTCQKLATLLLKAMKEQGFDVSQIPNDTFPEVDWVAANPAEELQHLAESLGCRVVMGTGGRVGIYPLGEGNELPELDSQLTKTFGVDPPDRPDIIKLVCGPDRYQSTFVLEAVGQEVDTVAPVLTDTQLKQAHAAQTKLAAGDIKKIDDLSYKPKGGWQTEFPPYFGNVASPNGGSDNQTRARAADTVYSMYRINGTADNSDGTYNIQGYTGTVSYRWQVLPLENGMVETYVEEKENSATGEKAPVEAQLPPKIEGIFWDKSSDDTIIDSIRPVTISFSLDASSGIVTFSEPIYQLKNGQTFPAQLWLTVGHPIKNADSRQPVRTVFTQSVPGESTGTGPLIIRRDEMQRRYIGSYKQPPNNITKTSGNVWSIAGAQSNADTYNDLKDEANYTLQATLYEIQDKETSQASYGGLVNISPDGAIQQVQWSMSSAGLITTASRNAEHDPHVPGYRERSTFASLRALRLQSRQLLQVANSAAAAAARPQGGGFGINFG